MSDPYLGEIHIFTFDFVPSGYALCDGSLLPINTNSALYSLLGTYYGGDGKTTFALPDLRGRTPIHPDHMTTTPGSKGGTPSETLNISHLPIHTHRSMGSSDTVKVGTPVNNVWASHVMKPYATSANTNMDAAAVGSAGDNQPHNNMQPYLAINFCIALRGVFPSRD